MIRITLMIYKIITFLSFNLFNQYTYLTFSHMQDVERFAKYRQAKHGVPVQMVCFEEAEHVKLYASQPQRYIQCVCKFISDCLAQYQNMKFNASTKID